METDIKMPVLASKTDRERIEELYLFLCDLVISLRKAFLSVKDENGASMSAILKEVSENLLFTKDIVSRYTEVLTDALADTYAQKSDIDAYISRYTSSHLMSPAELADTFCAKTSFDEEVLSVKDALSSLRGSVKNTDENGVEIQSAGGNARVFVLKDSVILSCGGEGDISINGNGVSVRDVKVNSSVSAGGFRTDTSDGLVIRWEGI